MGPQGSDWSHGKLLSETGGRHGARRGSPPMAGQTPASTSPPGAGSAGPDPGVMHTGLEGSTERLGLGWAWPPILPVPPKGHLKPKNVTFTRTDLKSIANKINFYYFL